MTRVVVLHGMMDEDASIPLGEEYLADGYYNAELLQPYSARIYVYVKDDRVYLPKTVLLTVPRTPIDVVVKIYAPSIAETECPIKFIVKDLDNVEAIITPPIGESRNCMALLENNFERVEHNGKTVFVARFTMANSLDDYIRNLRRLDAILELYGKCGYCYDVVEPAEDIDVFRWILWELVKPFYLHYSKNTGWRIAVKMGSKIYNEIYVEMLRDIIKLVIEQTKQATELMKK